LPEEARARQEIGLEVDCLDRDEITERYGIPSHGGLLTARAGVVDPVRLTRRLLERSIANGAGLVSRAGVFRIQGRRGAFSIETDRSRHRAAAVVFATGYETPPEVADPRVKLTSTYALVTEPLRAPPSWLGDTIVWETARPYTYLRGTDDGRILVGGADLPFRDPDRRDRRLRERRRVLERRLVRWLPTARGLETSYAWAGTFAENPDGLPLIGPVPGQPGLFTALAYGGNGIVFSVVAARLLRDQVLGLPNDDGRLFQLGKR
jgi:glycine/D-amino acid oxidase-like deaminating enzyme